MRIILLLFCLLHNIGAYSNPVSTYYDLVNEAELLICKDKFNYALEHYDKAFSLKGMSPWGRDVYNAWVCAYKLKDEDHFRQYSNLLISRDAFIPKGPAEILNEIDSSYASYYTAIWDELRKGTKTTIDYAYRDRLIRFLADDQQLRQYCIKLYDGYYNIGGRDTLNTFDSLNVLEMQRFFSFQGFPTEYNSGFWDNLPINPPVYHLVLRHDRSWTNRHTLDSTLYFEVLNGKFPPMIYAMLKDESFQGHADSFAAYQHQPFSSYGTNVFSVLDGKLCTDTMRQERMRRVNAARSDIYLESQTDMCAKGLYQFKNSYFHLLYGDLFAHFDGLPDDIIAQIKSFSYTDQQIYGFNTIGTRRCKHGLRH